MCILCAQIVLGGFLFFVLLSTAITLPPFDSGRNDGKSINSTPNEKRPAIRLDQPTKKLMLLRASPNAWPTRPTSHPRGPQLFPGYYFMSRDIPFPLPSVIRADQTVLRCCLYAFSIFLPTKSIAYRGCRCRCRVKL